MTAHMIISTRKPADADFDCLLRIHHAAYHDVVVDQFGSWDEPIHDRCFADKWAAGELQVLQMDGRDCGFIWIRESNQAITVSEIVIDPEFQNRGVGTQFMRSIQDRASALHLPVRLRVLRRNRALAFYKRLGFVETGESPTHFEMERPAGSISPAR